MGGGEEGAFVTANCSRRLETIVSIFLFYLTETVFEWIEVWCLKILVVSKFQEILFFMTKMKIAWFI